MDTNLKLFNKYSSEIEEYKKNVENTTIESKDEMLFATGLLNKIQWTIREINWIKKTLKDPVIALWKSIESKYKETLAPFDEVKQSLVKKQVVYQEELEKERQRLETEEKARFEAKQKALEEAQVVDQDVKEIVEEKHEEKKQIIEVAYDQSKQKWFYYDYEIDHVDIFNVNRKYLRIKPLSAEADVNTIKSDLKAWKEIEFVTFSKVWKVK